MCMKCFSGCAQIVEPALECDELVHTYVTSARAWLTEREKNRELCARPDGSCSQTLIYWHTFDLDSIFKMRKSLKIAEISFIFTFNCFCVSRSSLCLRWLPIASSRCRTRINCSLSPRHRFPAFSIDHSTTRPTLTGARICYFILFAAQYQCRNKMNWMRNEYNKRVD